MISPNYHFTFEGAAKTVQALEKFQPNLKKSLDRKIGKVLSVIVNQARAERYLSTYILQVGQSRL